MSSDTKSLITAERRRTNFGFLTAVIQRERKRPAKYKHFIRIPVYLYEELCNRSVIKSEDYYIDETAFFEFSESEATISFVNLYLCEDMHRKIDHYLVVKFAGSYPLKRGCRSAV